ncbi:Chromosome (plasmid) partitioning protein ParA [hydrothermal vent metagenome]|uniref:Chromosome (Plasmid) partitioning protein ParA n=1 Tax=hydrothermal vent metagenome TaxID=652676 RepID=A0A3B1CEN7_9ZZZZ
MGRIVAIANQKGGVGKTTTAINLAASLALAEKDILIIDADPQGNSSSGLGIDRNNLKSTLYDVFVGRAGMEEVIAGTEVEKLSIVPSSIDLLAVEVELVDRPEREAVLAEALRPIAGRFEYIIVDCPPSLGLLTLNALVAAASVLVPVQCEYYALEGLGLLTRTVNLVRDSYNPALQIEGILLTMFDSRNSLSRQVAQEVKKHFGDVVYSTVIPRNVTLSEAPGFGKPVMLYDARSRGAQSYFQLAKEILSEGRTR